MATTGSSFLERFGGLTALRAVLVVFEEKVHGDKEIVKFFNNNNAQLKLHQFKVMKIVFNEDIAGSQKLADIIVRRHLKLFVNVGLTVEHFDRLADHLVESVREISVNEEQVVECKELIKPVRKIFDESAREYGPNGSGHESAKKRLQRSDSRAQSQPALVKSKSSGGGTADDVRIKSSCKEPRRRSLQKKPSVRGLMQGGRDSMKKAMTRCSSRSRARRPSSTKSESGDDTTVTTEISFE